MKKTYFLIASFMLFSCIAVCQCYPDRHSTNFYDGWISCEVAASPNPARPASHFIMYDFGKIFSLGQMQIWNTNDPSHLDWGIKDVAIDYSMDSINWIHAGDYTFAQASGLSIYEGTQGPQLEGIEARFLLLTALSNYGGECYGLSEMKVEGTEVIISDVEEAWVLDCVDFTIYPNPFAEKITLSISADCAGEMRCFIYDATGRNVFAEKVSVTDGEVKIIGMGENMPSGTYILSLEFNGQSVQKNIVKLNRL